MKTLTLKLDAIEYLFVEPEEDLFAEHEYDVLGMSGMEWVSKQIGPRWRFKREDYRLIIQLPPAQFETGIQPRAQRAIKRYCQLAIDDNHFSMNREYRLGLWLLVVGLIFLGVCLALAAVFHSSMIPAFPTSLNYFLANGLIILGWIGLWYPAELLLFAWIPYVRENQLYRLVMDMEIEVQPWA